MTASKGPLTFKPMNGLLSLLDRAAEALGVADTEIYRGAEGLRSVAQSKLQEIGVPDKPIALTGNPAATPRRLAEQAGFIRRRRRIKR